MSQFFASGGPSMGVSALASVLPINIQGCFPLELTGLISFAVQGTLKSLLQHHSSKASILRCSAFFMAQLTTHMTTEKTIALTVWTFLGIALTVRTFVQASLITQLLKKRPAMLERVWREKEPSCTRKNL